MFVPAILESAAPPPLRTGEPCSVVAGVSAISDPANEQLQAALVVAVHEAIGPATLIEPFVAKPFVQREHHQIRLGLIQLG